MNLIDILKQSEGKTVEFKRDLSSPEKILRTLVAFANTAGGVVLIGIEDKTKAVRGMAKPLEEEERLANLISEGIAPRLVPDLEILAWHGAQVLAARVYPSPTRPHFLRGLGPDNGVFVRVGSTNRKADVPLIAELRRSTLNSGFDEGPVTEADSEAVDFRVAAELFAPTRKLAKKDLEVLRMVTRHQGRLVPTVAGILLFGRNREELFPDAWIQCGLFAGSDRQSILDRAEFREYLPIAVDKSLEFVRKHSLRGAVIGSVRRTDQWSIPPAVAREALINAAVHADYSQRGAPIRLSIFADRVEVENPGLLLCGLTIDDILRGVSKLRNHVIGRVFNELGLIEQWGSGIQRMCGVCREAGLPDPVFEEIGTHFRVTVNLRQERQPAMDEADRRIRQLLGEAVEGLPTREIAAAVRLTPRAIRARLRQMVEAGVVQAIGRSDKDPFRRYVLVGTCPAPAADRREL